MLHGHVQSSLPRARDTLNILLSNNEKLLDKFVNEEIVDTFIENIRGSIQLSDCSMERADIETYAS